MTADFDLDQALSAFSRVIQNKPTNKESVSERTTETYVRNVEFFVEWLNEERDKGALEAETSDLRVYLRRRSAGDIDGGAGDADNTLRTRRSAISRFYGELQGMAEDGEIPIEANECPTNPEEGHDAVWASDDTKLAAHSGQEVHYLDPEEIRMIVDNVSAPKLRNSLIIKLLYHTGMRAGELAQTKLTHVHSKDCEITIPSAIAKGDGRRVAFKPTLKQDLRRWIDGGYRDAEHYATDSEYLFPTNDDVHISTETIARIVRNAADSAGLNEPIYTDKRGHQRMKVSTHILRHSMAVNALKDGTLNVRELQELLGHQDLETTEQYLKIASEDATSKYHKFGGPPEASN